MLTSKLLPAIYTTLQGWRAETGTFVLPCTKREGVQDLVLTFGGQDWPIDYQDIL